MSSLRWFAERRSMPDPLDGIDSETLLRALSRCHRGEDVPALGLAPWRAASILPYSNHLSTGTRQAWYRRGTAAEAIDPVKYPADSGTFYRYHAVLPEAIPDRHPMPVPVDLGEFEAFVEDLPREAPIEWIGG